jgi:hypothetical protein
LAFSPWYAASVCVVGRPIPDRTIAAAAQLVPGLCEGNHPTWRTPRRRSNDQDWGSNRHIDAEKNLFFDLVCKELDNAATIELKD